jgi:hypothetical protein
MQQEQRNACPHRQDNACPTRGAKEAADVAQWRADAAIALRYVVAVAAQPVTHQLCLLIEQARVVFGADKPVAARAGTRVTVVRKGRG